MKTPNEIVAPIDVAREAFRGLFGQAPVLDTPTCLLLFEFIDEVVETVKEILIDTMPSKAVCKTVQSFEPRIIGPTLPPSFGDHVVEAVGEVEPFTGLHVHVHLGRGYTADPAIRSQIVGLLFARDLLVMIGIPTHTRPPTHVTRTTAPPPTIDQTPRSRT